MVKYLHEKAQQESCSSTGLQEGSNLDSFQEATQEWDRLLQLYRGTAANILGYQCAQEGDFKQAVEYWHKSVNGDYAKGHFNLGLCYEQGLGVAADTEKARSHYRVAARQGHAGAMYNLAVMLLREAGPGDREAALDLLDQAASQGVTQVMTKIM